MTTDRTSPTEQDALIAFAQGNPNRELISYTNVPDLLSELLAVSGLTTECEYPNVVLRTRRGDETVICVVDGGEAYCPAVVFARWATNGQELPSEPTLRVHLPDMPGNHTLAADIVDGRMRETVWPYLDQVWGNSDVWRPLADELREPSVLADPVLYDETD